jgi:8-oxo-dGTP pyrophosphatase MutT (NUDIX family)
MNFQDFLKYVPKLVGVHLPATAAHFKMVPPDRVESLKKLNFDTINPKKAAVMMLFYPKKGRTHLVLIVRNSYEGFHSAQVALPGGKYETNDQTYANTALRETHEELGVDPKNIEIIMPFTKLYIQVSNFMVYPFLGICRHEVVFIPDGNEVVNVIELPLNDFLNDDLLVTTYMTTSYAEKIEIPAFQIDEHIVWGATAMMLSELKEVLKKVL